MTDEVDIKLKLETKQAKADLRALLKQKRRAKQKAAKGATMRSRVFGEASGRARMAVGALGGFGAVSRLTSSGSTNVDPWEAAQTPIRAAIQRAADSALGFNAKARTQALAETRARFSFVVGASRGTDQAKDYYNFRLRELSDQETGKQILRLHKDFRGPDFVDLIKRSVEGYTILLRRSMGYLRGQFTD
jgi:Cdc6-like AAA superfamily ATPase